MLFSLEPICTSGGCLTGPRDSGYHIRGGDMGHDRGLFMRKYFSYTRTGQRHAGSSQLGLMPK